MLLTDTQINSVAKAYINDENFGSFGSELNMWKFYNLLTGANKSSYIDSFLDRSLNATEMAVEMCIRDSTWMASNTHVQHLYNKYGDGADVCVTEGVMGLFDGYQRMQGSSAEIARLLNIPVVLIVSARSTAYSVAPLIYGFKHFNPAVKIAGIVFNQVSSPSHFAYLREACVDAGVECLGYLPMTEGLKIPSRHLGLTLTAKRSMNTLIEQAAELVGKYVDLDKLLSRCV